MEEPHPETTFARLQALIRSRRTIGVAGMNGRQIPDAQVQQLLELADWAPTHGRTEPWRFFVYRGEALRQFALDHADLYWQHTPADQRDPHKQQKLQAVADKASHLVVAVMQRGSNPRIPAIEELAATAAAIEHILLGATALGLASIWNSGGMTHHPAMKVYLKLQPEDQVLGLIYLGYSDKEPDSKRLVPLAEKVKWM